MAEPTAETPAVVNDPPLDASLSSTASPVPAATGSPISPKANGDSGLPNGNAGTKAVVPLAESSSERKDPPSSPDISPTPKDESTPAVSSPGPTIDVPSITLALPTPSAEAAREPPDKPSTIAVAVPPPAEAVDKPSTVPAVVIDTSSSVVKPPKAAGTETSGGGEAPHSTTIKREGTDLSSLNNIVRTKLHTFRDFLIRVVKNFRKSNANDSDPANDLEPQAQAQPETSEPKTEPAVVESSDNTVMNNLCVPIKKLFPARTIQTAQKLIPALRTGTNGDKAEVT